MCSVVTYPSSCCGAFQIHFGPIKSNSMSSDQFRLSPANNDAWPWPFREGTNLNKSPIGTWIFETIFNHSIFFDKIFAKAKQNQLLLITYSIRLRRHNMILQEWANFIIECKPYLLIFCDQGHVCEDMYTSYFHFVQNGLIQWLPQI